MCTSVYVYYLLCVVCISLCVCAARTHAYVCKHPYVYVVQSKVSVVFCVHVESCKFNCNTITLLLCVCVCVCVCAHAHTYVSIHMCMLYKVKFL